MTTHPARKRAAEQFHRQAGEYARSPAHFNAESLKMIGELAREQRFPIAVDIATGPGFTAFEISDTVDTVLATDPAIGMLQQVRRLAKKRKIYNINLVALEAENLPFRDQSVDLVTVRTAPHHFTDVDRFLREAKRVLRQHGSLILADTSSPESKKAEEWMDDVERRRDPTHIRNLSSSAWRKSITRAGLVINFEGSARVELKLMDWLKRSATPADESERLIHDWSNAPGYAVETFRIAPLPGKPEDFAFSWPVYVARASVATR